METAMAWETALTAEQSQVLSAARLGGVNDPHNETHSLGVARGSTL